MKKLVTETFNEKLQRALPGYWKNSVNQDSFSWKFSYSKDGSNWVHINLAEVFIVSANEDEVIKEAVQLVKMAIQRHPKLVMLKLLGKI